MADCKDYARIMKNLNDIQIIMRDNPKLYNDFIDMLIEVGTQDSYVSAFCLSYAGHQNGNIGSTVRLSRLYSKGLGTKVDLDESIRLISSAYESGHKGVSKERTTLLLNRGKQSDFESAFSLIISNYDADPSFYSRCSIDIINKENNNLHKEELLQLIESHNYSRESIKNYIRILGTHTEIGSFDPNYAYEQFKNRNIQDINFNTIVDEELIESNCTELMREKIYENRRVQKNNREFRCGLIKNYFDINNPLKSLGWNTGNLAFWSSIENIFNPDIIPHSFVNPELMSDYDSIILTDLIWIRENKDFSYLKRLIGSIKCPIVPMSVGLQSETDNYDFKLHDSVVDVLTDIQNKATIGVRGKYTKEVLKQYGIDNTQVIGCPSMYYWLDPYFKFEASSESEDITTNFKTFSDTLSTQEYNVLSYLMKNSSSFIEQTSEVLTEELCSFRPDSERLCNEILTKRKLYYDNDSWLSGISNNKFSIGLRFHGNVMAIRAGIPSLFITTDSRVRELTSYFNLPSISIDDFDTSLPIDYYIDLADYTSFNNNYRSKYDNFLKFIKKNNLEMANEDK